MNTYQTHRGPLSPQALPAQPTLRQTADYFGVDIKTVRRWITDRRLVAYRIGPRLVRVDRASILKLASPIGGGAA